MRLTDLSPRWIGGPYSGPERRGCGISFDCPVHRSHRIGVNFANPIDGGAPAPDEFCRDGSGRIVRWQRTGETFDTLTLTPSVDASKHTENGTPCWHGFIQNGEIVGGI